MKTQSVLLRIFTIVFTAAVLLISTLTFQVQQYENAVLIFLGKPVRVIKEPGLYFRYPWPLSSVERLDKRLDVFEIRTSETLTRDKRNVVLPFFVAWRIEEPQRYLESIGSTENARNQIDNLITNAKNVVIGRYDFNQLISSNPEKVKLEEIQNSILEEVGGVILADYGVKVEEIGILRISLPEANTSAVFDRMRAERAKVAAQLRAEGRQQADAVRAEADTNRTIALAEANRAAAETIGRGESEAAAIYRETYGKNPDLYRFLRELESLEKVTGSRTRVILDTQSPPFHHLQNPGNQATPAE